MSDTIIAILLVAAFVFVGVGGVVIAYFLSIGATASIYKHQDWKYRDAVDYLAYRGFASTVLFVSVLVATWGLPQLVALPVSRDWIIATQLITTGIAFIAANVYWHVVVNRLRRPPEA